MEIHDPQPYIVKSERRKRRDTISVTRCRPSKNDKKWYGHAPRIVPETDRHFRPKEFKF